MGTKYNELCQLLGQDQAEVLGEDHPRLIFSELAPLGRVANRFSEDLSQRASSAERSSCKPSRRRYRR